VLQQELELADLERVERMRIRIEAAPRSVRGDFLRRRAAHLDRLAAGDRDQRVIDLVAVGGGRQRELLLQLGPNRHALAHHPRIGLREKRGIDVGKRFLRRSGALLTERAIRRDRECRDRETECPSPDCPWTHSKPPPEREICACGREPKATRGRQGVNMGSPECDYSSSRMFWSRASLV